MRMRFSDPTKTEPSPPRAQFGALAVTLLFAASLSGCAPAEKTAARAPELVTVEPASVRPVAQKVSLTGTIAARVVSNLSFRTSGRISERRVDVGDHVKAGDVLAMIAPVEQQADVASANAALQAAQASLVQAQSSFDRQQHLMDGGFTTRSSFDSAQEQLRAAHSTVDAAKADLAAAQEQLSLTVLKADADGVITARDAETGQVVAPAQTVFTLAHNGGRDAIFNVYEGILASHPPKDGITVKLLSNPDVVASAVVREVSPALDTTTGTVQVTMSLIDPPAAMGLGAAVLGIGTTETENLIMLPWTSLAAGESGPAVWIVDRDTNTVSQRPIKVDRYKAGEILVAAGLKEGELVVTSGGQFLHTGQSVAIATGAAS